MLTLIILSVVLVAGYFYCVKNYDYWKKRGVPYIQPVVIFGCMIDPFLQRRSKTELFVEWYKKYPDEKVVGLFEATKPCLLIRDPELVKRVLITDFVSFHERGLHPDREGMEPLLSNLFFVEGDLWRSLRQRMTPAFTSGKLKAMFPLIVERAEKLQTRALNAACQGKVIDARDLMARYTTDFIGACGFGLDADSLNEENSDFRELGKAIFRFDFMHGVKSVLKNLFPRFFRSVKFFGHIENQVLSLVYNIQKQRNFQPSNRHDFIDLLMECQRKGPIEIESLVKVKADGTPSRTIIEMTDQLLAAQVFIFFAAGFETSSSSTSYTLHQLAYNPKVLKKVQKEIDKVLSKHDNKLSFEAVKEMTYLEWTFREGMRMFPSLGYLSRLCTQKYTFPELDLTIDKEVGIIIPLQALHMDPQYFENPAEFRPERFDPENEKESNKYVYLPFGQGPRACIGERLGLMQSLAGLAAVLSKFDVTPAPESKRVLDVKPQYDIVQNIAGGIPLLFKERKKVD